MGLFSSITSAARRVGVALDKSGLTKMAASAVGAGGVYDTMAAVNSARKGAMGGKGVPADAGVPASEASAAASPSPSMPSPLSRIGAVLTKPAVIVTGAVLAAVAVVALIFRRSRS